MNGSDRAVRRHALSRRLALGMAGWLGQHPSQSESRVISMGDRLVSSGPRPKFERFSTPESRRCLIWRFDR